MPMRELQAYVAELPRLRAARALEQAESTSVGLGLDPKGRSGILGRWRRAIAHELPGTLRRQPGKLAALARSAGIGFRTVKRGAKP